MRRINTAPPGLSSQVVKKSCYPRWNETFEFDLDESATEKLCVEVWDWDLVSRNDFLGKVRESKPWLFAFLGCLQSVVILTTINVQVQQIRPEAGN